MTQPTSDIIEEGVEPLVRDFCSVVPMSKSEARERLRSFAQRILEAARDEEAIRCHVHSEEAFEAGKKEGAEEAVRIVEKVLTENWPGSVNIVSLQQCLREEGLTLDNN